MDRWISPGPGGETLILDPWTEGNPVYPKGFEIQRCDTILVSHGHFDHIHDVVPLAKKFGPAVVAIFETCVWLGKKGLENTRPMNKGGSQQVGSVEITMTHAVHSCGIQDDDGSIIYGGEAAGYILTFEDGRVVYFAGDTNVFSDMALIAELYKPDLALLPIGDLFTMGPQEAAVAAGCSVQKRSSRCTSAPSRSSSVSPPSCRIWCQIRRFGNSNLAKLWTDW